MYVWIMKGREKNESGCSLGYENQLFNIRIRMQVQFLIKTTKGLEQLSISYSKTSRLTLSNNSTKSLIVHVEIYMY